MKRKSVLLGIFFWMIALFELIFQIILKNIPVELQFCFFILILLLGTNNQTALLITLYIEKKYQKRKINLKYYVYTAVNLLFFLYCLYTIFVIFLFF